MPAPGDNLKADPKGCWLNLNFSLIKEHLLVSSSVKGPLLFVLHLHLTNCHPGSAYLRVIIPPSQKG